MRFNYLTAYYTLTIAGIGVLILSLPGTTLQSTNLPDMLSRTIIDDSYLNLYYFYWTNFWYLPLFFSAILLTVGLVVCVGNIHLTLKAPTLLLLSVGVVEVIDYTGTNTLLHGWVSESLDFNTLLTNNINKYHPFLLYCGLALLVSLSVEQLYSSLSYKSRFRPTMTASRPLSINYTATLILTTTLYLGSWWAVQEGSWGGWWNWDPSEVFGLLAMGFFVRRWHLLTNPALTEPVLTYTKVFIRVIVILYLFIQINFDLVSHNFGTKSNVFVDPIYTYISVLCFFMGSLVVLLRACIIRYVHYTIVGCRPTQYGPKVLISGSITLTLCISAIIYLSFIVLLNDFLWKFFNLNLWNGVYTHTWFLVCIWLLVKVRLWGYSLLRAAVFFMAAHSPQGWVYSVLVFMDYKSVRTHLIHILLLVFLLLNLVSASKLSNIWDVITMSVNTSHDRVSSVVSQTYVSYTNTLLEVATPLLMSGTVVEPVWGFVYKDTSPEARVFSHLCTLSGSEQTLFLGNNIFRFAIHSLDNSSLPLSALLYGLLTLLSLNRHKPLVIVF